MTQEFAPPDGEKGNLWKKILLYTIYLLFWVLLSASALWVMFDLRAVVVELMIAAQLNPWSVRGYDRWIIFVFGLGWFIAMMWMEHYLRTAIDKQRLWRNIAYLASVQIALIAMIFGIRLLI